MKWFDQLEINEPNQIRYDIYQDASFPTTEIPVVSCGNIVWSNEQYVAACTDNGIEVFHLDSHLLRNGAQGKYILGVYSLFCF